GWSFGIKSEQLQKWTDVLRKEKKVDVVIILSHNGLEVDKKLLLNLNGVDLIISGHTHDTLPHPLVKRGNKLEKSPAKGDFVGPLLVQAGSHGKVLGRIDFEVSGGRIKEFSHKLYPIMSNAITPDPEVKSLIDKWHKPYRTKLSEKLAKSESLLYRRDTFNGTMDSVITQAIKAEYDAEIVFSPGYRWGTTLLPGDDITLKDVFDFTAVTYPKVWTFDLKGETLKNILEDILDNVFNEDPYQQQGGDFSRLQGLELVIDVNAPMLKRIKEIKVNGKAFNPARKYKISAWGGNLYRAGENVRADARPVYDVVAKYLRSEKTVKMPQTDYIKLV
ncbi:MAG: 5'-nucleotidase C-terminal domain-containing protein, partial [Spirochaetota bacterium]|nr:5'-nucleotidase C-terminal domain-containing protein [Spirochaetota bacterium]